MPEITILWLVLGIVLVIIELTTINLVTVWFAAGSFAAFAMSAAGAGVRGQVIVFCIVTAILLACTRPFAKKVHNSKISRTNADAILGETGLAEEEINNLAGTGKVTVNGQPWSARSADGSIIPAGSYVEVGKIEGVKLIVSKIPGRIHPQEELK